ncbi:MAG: NAD(P)-dependent oxidoreductase [Clostridia bacterium]|nr:NAD(P)-dependent oxidoreductase [Clostridia bacterium]
MHKFTDMTTKRINEMNDFSIFGGKRVLITGATGLIGRSLTRKLLQYGAKVIAMVRNEEKAHSTFSDIDNGNIEYLVMDVTTAETINLNADYIIHGASITSSKAFVEEPVDVIMGAVIGTKNLLEIARVNNVKSFVYLSSMEIYGAPSDDAKILENNASNLNTMTPRSGYPESKRLSECLCASYAAQYGVPAKVVRLTQTFGEGVVYQDSRVFAEFARCVLEQKDIVLKTKGETKRNYLYTEDAAEAILTVLLYGVVGEAYNAANEDTYCSIYEMAQIVANRFGQGKVKVRVEEENDISRFGFAPTLKMNLDCSKLSALGWQAQVGLETAFERMIKYMESVKSQMRG